MEKERYLLGMDRYFKASIKAKRALTWYIVAFISFAALIHLTKLPVNMISWVVPFKVDTPEYVPFNVENKYGKVIGLTFDRVEIAYESSEESIKVLATSELGWNHVSTWDEQITLTNGKKGYYNKSDNNQRISWQKGKVEYAIDYKGIHPIDKEELIKVASSVK